MKDAPISLPQVAQVPRDAWDRLRERRIFFGHQSVGEDIIEGVREVVAAHPHIALRLHETTEPSEMRLPGLFHARVGANGAPATKLAEFVRLVTDGVSDAGLALLKYCYVDVSRATDVDALFAAYHQAVGALRASHPRLTILHVTLPLETDWGTYFHWKRVIRARLTTHRELNAIRQAYNVRMRTAYAGREPVFDLALWQSIGADGRAHTVRYRGQRVPILAREWTHDGGHLNAAGRRRIAEAFLVALAAL